MIPKLNIGSRCLRKLWRELKACLCKAKTFTDFSSYQQLTDYLGAPEFQVPLKLHRSNFTATLLKFTFEQTPNVAEFPADKEIITPFGTVLGDQTQLGNWVFSSTILPQDDGSSHVQGDVVPYIIPGNRFPTHTHVMILSHSCNISREKFVLACPIYWESNFSDQLVRAISSSRKRVHAFEWLKNKRYQIVGFPAVERANEPGRDEEPFVVPLTLISSVSFSDIASIQPCVRLSYRGVGYLQWRMGMFLQRDPQNSDVRRDL